MQPPKKIEKLEMKQIVETSSIPFWRHFSIFSGGWCLYILIIYSYIYIHVYVALYVAIYMGISGSKNMVAINISWSSNMTKLSSGAGPAIDI